MKSYLIALCMFLLAIVACSPSGKGEEEEHVKATASALTHSLTASPLAVLNGSFAAHGCKNHLTNATDNTWSVNINGSTSPLPHPALEVVKNNTSCMLGISSIITEDGTVYTIQANAPSIFPTWAPSHVSFTDANPSDDPLYTNYEISSLAVAYPTYDSDFNISILYSDDVSDIDSSVNSHFQVVKGTATASRVPAPDYAAPDLSTLLVNVDAFNHVSDYNGSAPIPLAQVAQTADTYVLLPGSLPSITFATVDAAYTGGTASPMSDPNSLDLGSLLNPSGALPIGTVLPASFTIIFAHTEQDVPSYEVFTITVNKSF